MRSFRFLLVFLGLFSALELKSASLTEQFIHAQEMINQYVERINNLDRTITVLNRQY